MRKQDIYIAKNYLTEDEFDSLNRLVTIFLETAELRAKNRQDIAMDFWRDNVDKIIAFNDRQLLTGSGSVSHAQMEKTVDAQYEQFNAQRKQHEARQADAADQDELKGLEEKIKAKAPKKPV